MRKRISTLIIAVLAVTAFGGITGAATARQGADDPAGHVRHSGGTDDPAGDDRRSGDRRGSKARRCRVGRSTRHQGHSSGRGSKARGRCRGTRSDRSDRRENDSRDEDRSDDHSDDHGDDRDDDDEREHHSGGSGDGPNHS